MSIFACVVVLLKTAESTRLKLFQKLIEAYTDACKEKKGEDMQLEVSGKWKKLEKIKDFDLEIAVDKRISKLEKLSTKRKVRTMAIWTKFSEETQTRNIPLVIVFRIWYLANFSSNFQGFPG